MKSRLLVSIAIIIAASIAYGGYYIKTASYDNPIYNSFVEQFYPATKEYFIADKSGKWIETTDANKAEYYRIIRYKYNGDIVGKVRDYYSNGQLQWEGYVTCTSPFIRKGICESYYENGHTKSIAFWKDGQKEGIASSFTEDGVLELEQYFQEGNLIIPAYHDLDHFIANKELEELKAIGSTLNEAYVKEKQKKFAAAAKILEPLKKQYPEYTYPIERSAYFNLLAKNFKNASQDYESLATSNYPNKEKAKCKKVVSLYYMRDFGNAITEADQLLATNDLDTLNEQYLKEASAYKGLSLMKQNKAKEGESIVEAALKNNNNPEVMYEWAKYYTDKRQFAASNVILNDAISKNKNFSPFYGLRSSNYYALGNYSNYRSDHDHYVNISSKYFFDSPIEFVLRIDYEQQRHLPGWQLIEAAQEVGRQYDSWRNENPLPAIAVDAALDWLGW